MSGLAFIGSIVWCFKKCDYDSVVSAITTLAALVTIFIGEKRTDKKVSQVQKVDKNGIGIQAGGNVTTGSVRVSSKTKNAK